MRLLEPYVVDTHALLWFMTDDQRLSAEARRILRAAEQGECQALVPTIVLAELLSIVERKRPDLSVETLWEMIDRLPTFAVVPFDLLVFEEMVGLSPTLELHDRVIAATARVYGAKALSRDSTLGQAVERVW